MSPDARNCVQAADGGCTLALHVQPRARRTEVCGVRNGRLHVRISAPPVDGKANDELVRLFRREFRIPKSAVELIAGETSREKVVRLNGVTPRAALQRLDGGVRDSAALGMKGNRKR